MGTWTDSWDLDRDPFDPRRPLFVPIEAHAEAVARLVHAVESGVRSARLVAGPGLGKSVALDRALATIRRPGRKVARVDGPIDGASLYAGLAAGLGVRVSGLESRARAWQGLVEAARLCRWQGLQIVLVVEDSHTLTDPADRVDLDRLDHLDTDPSARLTVVRVGRPREDDSLPGDALPIRLSPLTRSEVARYVASRLEAAGGSGETFTPRALTRLHARSGGVPGRLDRLARLALIGGSVRGLEVVSAEVVEAAAFECDEVGVAGGPGVG